MTTALSAAAPSAARTASDRTATDPSPGAAGVTAWSPRRPSGPLRRASAPRGRFRPSEHSPSAGRRPVNSPGGRT